MSEDFSAIPSSIAPNNPGNAHKALKSFEDTAPNVQPPFNTLKKIFDSFQAFQQSITPPSITTSITPPPIISADAKIHSLFGSRGGGK